MIPTEAVKLAGYTRAHFPSQPIDDYTADALAELLAPYSLTDCQAAVLSLAMRTHDHAEKSKWCSPTDIYAEVRRARADRLEGAVIEPPPNADPDDVAGYLRWLRGEREAIASGRPATADSAPALPKRDVIAELGMAGTSVNEALASPIREAKRAAMEGRKQAQAARKPEPEPLLAPSDHSREPEPAATTTTEETEA